MIAMQRAQPEIKKLQAKYKNDRQKLNEEMMKFYKENEINPLGGCLPLVAQMPVFIALYQTLRDIQHFIPTSSQMYASICGAGTPEAKCTQPAMDFFGLNLTQSASSATGGLIAKLPYFVLAALVVVSAYYQQRQTMRNQTNVNPQMQIIGKVMPLVFGMFAISMPAGVVLYFLTSNLWQIGQQEVVFRTIGTAAGGPVKKAGTVEAKSTDVTAAPATGGVKGLFKSLTPAAADDGGGTSAPAPKSKSTGSEKQQPSKGSKAGSGPASSDQTKGGPSPNARRKNNRKRKR
jgi:YidC/Oxa1 family membrane protein insertase